jgi:NADH dehydrogenase
MNTYAVSAASEPTHPAFENATLPLPPANGQPRVVVIGGGFGGLRLAEVLGKRNVQVVLLDRNNYHTFQPLLYQVATAGLEPDSIAYPLRKILKRHSNVLFRMGEAQRVDAERNVLETSIGAIEYDYLVIATGSKTNFFGMQGLEDHAMGMKSIPEALNIRSLVLQSFEQATLTNDAKHRQELMTFVVVGGGPTGVETAGALAELKKHVLHKDFPELDLRFMHIYLLEASPRLLNGMSDIAGEKAVEFLQAMGVNVLLGAQVKEYDGATITMQDGSAIASRTLIWAAGVTGATIAGLEHAVVRGNRLKVDAYNRVEGCANVFAIGDVAAMVGTDERFPHGHPMVAPVAMQQGTLVGKNILALLTAKNLSALQSNNALDTTPQLQPFRYFDKGSMATVGRNKAVVDIHKVRFQGWFAWVAWLGLHLIMLVGFRNKIVVTINWVWNYLSYDRGTRLIVRPFKRKSEA